MTLTFSCYYEELPMFGAVYICSSIRVISYHNFSLRILEFFNVNKIMRRIIKLNRACYNEI